MCLCLWRPGAEPFTLIFDNFLTHRLGWWIIKSRGSACPHFVNACWPFMVVVKVKLVLIFMLQMLYQLSHLFRTLLILLKRGVRWRYASLFGGSEFGEYQVSCLYYVLCLISCPLRYGLLLNQSWTGDWQAPMVLLSLSSIAQPHPVLCVLSQGLAV